MPTLTTLDRPLGPPPGLATCLIDLIEDAERDLKRNWAQDPILNPHDRIRTIRQLYERIATIDACPSESGKRHTTFALLLIETLGRLYECDLFEDEDAQALQSAGAHFLVYVKRDAHRALVEERGE